MSTANKLSYLNDTKSLLRTSLNKFGSNILSTDTFRSYDTKLNEIYDKLPKVTGSGSEFTLTPVQNGQVDDFKMIGTDLEQETVETITVSDWEQGTINDSNGYLEQSNDEVRTNDFIEIFPNTLYYISRTIYTSYMKFRFYDEQKNYVGSQATATVTTNKSENRMQINESSMELTINDSNIKYMKLIDHSNDLSTVYTITTNATPSPDYPQEIKVVEGRQVINVKGKNLFDINSGINTNNLIDAGITSVFNADGTITVNGEKTANYKYIRYSVTLPAGTYYFCGCPSGGSNSSYSSLVQLTQDTSSQIFDTGNGATFTLTEQTAIQYFPVRVGNASLTFNNTIFKPIISKVSVTYDDFEPYYNPVSYNIDLNLENIQLAKIPNTDYKNRIYKSNGNWYYEEKVKKVVLDGSETGTVKNIGTNNWFYQLSVNGNPTDQTKQMCSHYNNVGIYNSNTNQGIMLETAGNYIRIRFGTEDTIENYKSWLSTNNVEVWYPLVNPVTTQITNTTLINQLEALYLHTGTNIITISNDNNIIPEIEITRLKELEKLS